MTFLVQSPIVIDVVREPVAPARDIGVEWVLGMFAMAAVFLLAAALGSLLVGGIIVLIKRRRDATRPHDPEPSHTRLRI